MLVRSGIRFYKYWFSVTQAEQLARFKARETDPLKMWKLSPIDRPAWISGMTTPSQRGDVFLHRHRGCALGDCKIQRQEAGAVELCGIFWPLTIPARIPRWLAPDPLIVGRASQVLNGAGHILETALHPAVRRG